MFQFGRPLCRRRSHQSRLVLSHRRCQVSSPHRCLRQCPVRHQHLRHRQLLLFSHRQFPHRIQVPSLLSAQASTLRQLLRTSLVKARQLCQANHRALSRLPCQVATRLRFLLSLRRVSLLPTRAWSRRVHHLSIPGELPMFSLGSFNCHTSHSRIYYFPACPFGQQARLRMHLPSRRIHQHLLCLHRR